MKVALVQMMVGSDKQQNIANAICQIRKARDQGAQLVVLPECFNSPYGIKYFQTYAEEIPGGETVTALTQIARECGITLIGGTIPERRNKALFNTCIVAGPQGQIRATYQKMHLFDIDIPGKIRFKESEILTAGDDFASFTLDNGLEVGLGICYDLRFPELASILTNKYGCNVLIYPGAFNTTTGPLHWSLLQRARAVDQQSYVITCSPARPTDPNVYPAYGHSMVVAPTGEVIAEAGEGEELVLAYLDSNLITTIRSNIPVLRQKRTDIYDLPNSIKPRE